VGEEEDGGVGELALAHELELGEDLGGVGIFGQGEAALAGDGGELADLLGGDVVGQVGIGADGGVEGLGHGLYDIKSDELLSPID